MAHRLVLLRHGQSEWNKANKFTGWVDVGLTDQGVEEAREAGRLLAQEGLEFDVAYTSVLKRAIKTLWLSLEEMDQMWIPVHRRWRLNERHYGALAGLNKAETAEKHGEEQVKIWRRSYATPPPLLEENDPTHPKNDRRYARVSVDKLPLGEALKHTKERFMPCWENDIAPQLLDDKTVLVVAHGNSLRALVQHLDSLSEDEIMNVNIPTGMPLVYELDKDLKPLSKKYLGDADKVAKAMAEVEAQGKKKS